jgi:hypothetical protein
MQALTQPAEEMFPQKIAKVQNSFGERLYFRALMANADFFAL